MRKASVYKLPQVLTPAECGKLCRSITNLKHQAMVQLMYDCALRLTEVSHIRVKHINGDQKVLFISHSKGAKDRNVALMDSTLELLRKYWKRYRPGKGEAWLFPSESNRSQPYAARTLEYVVAKAAVRAAIGRKVNPHLLRHSRATHWKNAHMDLYSIKMLLGHASISSTEIYLHTAVETICEEARQAGMMIKCNSYVSSSVL